MKKNSAGTPKKARGLANNVETIFQSSAKTTRKLSGSKQQRYTVDLRIQTPHARGMTNLGSLSPVPALIRLARAKKLDCIAVADFFSGRSIDALEVASREAEVKVLPAMTLRVQLGQCDDITLLCLFCEGTSSSMVQTLLAELSVPKEMEGREDYVLRTPFKEVISIVERAGGVVVPSRIDKTPSSQAQIAMLVEECGFRAFDLAYAESVHWFRTRWPTHAFRFFSFSNATAFAQIGSRAARIQLPELSFSALSNVIQRDVTVAEKSI